MGLRQVVRSHGAVTQQVRAPQRERDSKRADVAHLLPDLEARSFSSSARRRILIRNSSLLLFSLRRRFSSRTRSCAGAARQQARPDQDRDRPDVLVMQPAFGARYSPPRRTGRRPRACAGRA
eukprot:CAMPEP_0202044610 /NCGR_PEP_ID=MMETSP0963-20130614/142_1 /ASSEMBLY_ACC=CAM_ASM_000494 /TAXON_ID=4773 /ORGANISM="Schizochytrium aggregatum, Strain ATCC28209" /LENGTH=121 /DNA_ID=CAMNT_0048609135 /DNA_START=249 /DNA_END=611 /DNA_ORIENTATION=+